jgi:hypothetical protein
MSSWTIEGEYMETCNCEYLCPCIFSNMTAKPTEGDCKVAIAMRIDKGQKDGVTLDGLSFIVVMQSSGPMIDGNMKVGLIVDEAADEAQTKAIADIVTGAAGGPMEALAPLVGEVAGIEKRKISFEKTGSTYSVTAGELVDQSLEAVESALPTGGPIMLENAAHPVSTSLALAKATHSKFHAFGIDWDDATGTRNGHFSSFSWAA